jgi:hypothetical protein
MPAFGRSGFRRHDTPGNASILTRTFKKVGFRACAGLPHRIFAGVLF